VDEFYYWPMERVATTVATTNDFKWNCNLVIIDFLIRHGIYLPRDDYYSTIMDRLRAYPTTLSRL
jgi:hypothetical protein